MKNSLILYRKRYIPNERIHLKDDVILKQTDDLIITQWDTLKPRLDIKRGLSAYFLKKGYKISKIYDAKDRLVYWYCDIIHTVYDAAENSYTFHDLLVDVLVEPNGFVKIVDLDELSHILTTDILPIEMISNALQITDNLLQVIYSGHFSTLTKEIEELES